MSAIHSYFIASEIPTAVWWSGEFITHDQVACDLTSLGQIKRSGATTDMFFFPIKREISVNTSFPIPPPHEKLNLLYT